MEKNKMYNRFLEKIKFLVNDEYSVMTPLEEFKNTNFKVIFKHNICGNEFSMEGKRFVHGNRCPECAKNIRKHKTRKGLDNFLKKLEELNPTLEYINGLTNVNDPVNLRCKICSFEFSARPTNILRKNKPTGCPKCAKNVRKDTNYFKNEIFDIVGSEYTVLGEYKNSNTKIRLKHNICNNEYDVTPHVFLSLGRRCPYCNGGVRLTLDEISKKIETLSNKEYTLISNEYLNNHTKIKLRHTLCKREYETTSHEFINGFGRCPYCNETLGESTIRQYLENHEYQYIAQFRIKELNPNYSFDFKDLDNDILIEYDGEFHYLPINTSDEALESFKQQKERDSIKNEFCLNNNITLLRIPFWEFKNINKILDLFYSTKDIILINKMFNIDINNLSINEIDEIFSKKNKKVFTFYKENNIFFNLNDYRKLKS